MNRKNFRVLLFTVTFAGLVLDAVIENAKDAALQTTTNFIVPFGNILVFISLYLFYEYNCVRAAKQEQRREKMNQHRHALIGNFLRTRKGGRHTVH